MNRKFKWKGIEKRAEGKCFRQKLFQNDRMLHKCKQQVGSAGDMCVLFFFGTREGLLFSRASLSV